MLEKKRLIIFDSNAVIHRAFHALPPLGLKKQGLVNAVYGFLLVFFKAAREFQPDYIAAVFDFPAPTFRHKKFKEYKAKRPPTPPELYLQIPKVKEILKAFGVPIFEKKGYEADDIIATICSKAPQKQVLPKIETVIISGDLDVLQLVDSNTKAYLLRRGVKDTILYDEAKTKERYQGLNPEQLLDFRALRGDPSDNIPGVTGVGEKTAIKLLKQFGDLENIYKEIKQDSTRAKKIKPKLTQLLIQHKEQAFFSQYLAKMEKNVPMDFNLEKCQWQKYDKQKAIEALRKFNFKSLIARMPDLEKDTGKTREKDARLKKNLKLW